MPEFSRPAAALSCDLAVIGGGVVGLWAARLAAARGLSVVLCERDRLGSGASGGVLGALMPHMPERWNGKKQFQFEALVTLPRALEDLEAETGISAGYRRIGRLMPLSESRHRQMALERCEDARQNWRSDEAADLSWSVIDAPLFAGWPAADASPQGVVLETLSARLDPRRLCQALATAVRNSTRVRVMEQVTVTTVGDRTIRLADGTGIAAGSVIVAAGEGSFGLLSPLVDVPAPAIGIPVKGQAALLRAGRVPEDRPLVFHDGVYVVPHAGGLVAVGSTSENVFERPFETDHRLDDVLARASMLCPELRDCEVVERWAGLRPKAIGRDPMIGVVSQSRRVIAATGGFKITLGIAHRMAAAAVGLGTGAETVPIPESFTPKAHLAKARRQEKSTPLGGSA
jgi:glycine oxidase